MMAVLRVLAFSALLVLAILAGTRLGRSAEDPVRLSAVPPPSLAALRDAGAELAPLGRAGVLEGWLVRKADGSVLTVYAAPGGHVVAGLLYGPDGLELTGAQLERAARPAPHRASPAATPATGEGTGAGRPDRESAEIALAHAVRAAAGQAAGPRHAVPGQAPADSRAALFERSLDVAAFTVGNAGPARTAGPDLVAFVDPGCPWSRRAAAELGQLALDGAFRLHAVPVGVMGPESHAQAVGILASSRPGLAWYRSDPQPAPTTAEDVLRLEANNALWQAFGADAVPWLAWRGRDGSVRTHAGLPASADFMGREGLR